MGGFLYIGNAPGEEGLPDVDVQGALAAFNAKGLTETHRLDCAGGTLYVFRKALVASENCVCYDNGDFIVATGTLIYKSLTGAAALRDLFADLWSRDPEFDDFIGHFCVIARKGEEVVLFNDFGGVYHVFHNAQKSVIASSFLAAVSALKPTRLCRNALYEYLTLSATFAEETLFEGILQLDARFVHRLRPTPGRHQKRVSFQPLPPDASLSTVIAETVDGLLRYYRSVHAAFGDDVAQGLSGGHDSRLMLALARRVGMRPHVFVYGRPDDPDVRVAHLIAAGERFDLDHLDKATHGPVAAADFPRRVREHFQLADGRGVRGAIDDGRELASRIDRGRCARLQLNGGGGEIYRNSWKVSDRSIGVREFLNLKFNTGFFTFFRERFDRHGFHAQLADKVKRMIATDADVLTRTQLEMLYPAMRLKYWMGQNNCFNNVLTFALTPFAEPSLTIPSTGIPLRYKLYGRLEGMLIRDVDEKLAGYVSVNGYSFTEPVSLRVRLKDFVKTHMPIALRPFVRRRFEPRQPRQYFLADDYLLSLFPDGTREIEEYVDLGRVWDRDLLNRALTVQLLLDYARGCGCWVQVTRSPATRQ